MSQSMSLLPLILVCMYVSLFVCLCFKGLYGPWEESFVFLAHSCIFSTSSTVPKTEELLNRYLWKEEINEQMNIHYVHGTDNYFGLWQSMIYFVWSILYTQIAQTIILLVIINSKLLNVKHLTRIMGLFWTQWRHITIKFLKPSDFYDVKFMTMSPF